MTDSGLGDTSLGLGATLGFFPEAEPTPLVKPWGFSLLLRTARVSFTFLEVGGAVEGGWGGPEEGRRPEL